MDLTQWDARIDTILARMTLEQKIGQMTQPDRAHVSPEQVKAFHIGSVLSGGGSFPGENKPSDWVAMNDAYWAASVEDDEHHVGIPLLYGVDAIHGHNNVLGATIFPHNIGLGAANDPALVQNVARITAREILATGVEWTFAPTLAVARNDHWGRTYESYGEDPEVAERYADHFVRGMQGDLGADSVVACVKHWVGDGGTTIGRDQGDTAISEEELRALHIRPYLPALREGALTVMASYNSWNGEKLHGHRYLLQDVLKDELGFQGFVVSDWDGTEQVHEDYRVALAQAVNAGVDMYMVPIKWQAHMALLKDLVEAGEVPVARIDDAVRRILRVKLAYGLFDRPRPAERPWSNSDTFGCEAHRGVAREAVRKSLVLLKHDGDVLPVDRSARILVTGKNAHDRGHQCGGFTTAWQGTTGSDGVPGGTSIWEGIQQVAPNAVHSWDGDAEGDFDVAIVVIGERPYAEGMGDVRGAGTGAVHPGSGGGVFSGSGTGVAGDGGAPTTSALHPYAATLDHKINHPEDLAMIERVRARGIPVVTVMISGRPVVANDEIDASQAFIAAWLPGSEGQGVSDVLFGDHDFQGKLTFSWPWRNEDNPNRGDVPDVSRFPYGFGLRVQGSV